jgi:glycosyltransferase involved in cell wall biosynthesis
MPNVRKLKIAFLLHHFHSGAAPVVAILCNTLASMGHDVTLILGWRWGAHLAAVKDNVRLVDFGRHRMTYSIPSLIRFLRRSSFDVVVSGLDNANIAALIARLFVPRSTKIITTEHNYPLVDAKAVQSPATRLLRALRKSLYPLADHMLAVSQGARLAVIERFNVSPSNITTIYNPMDLDRIARDRVAPTGHVWLEPKHSIPVVLSAGRLETGKDFATLLRAVAIVRKSKELRLIVLGEGANRSALEALRDQLGLTDCVDLYGFATNPFSFMAAADCFVLSSEWEGFGNVLLEAMACGSPVISTDCPSGPREILADGRYGRLVPIADENAMATAILETLSEPRLSEVYEARAREFKAEDIAERYLEQFYSLLQMSDKRSRSTSREI